jgi:hypothetical protein
LEGHSQEHGVHFGVLAFGSISVASAN